MKVVDGDLHLILQEDNKHMSQTKKGKVIGVDIDALDWDDVLNIMHNWAINRESRYLCMCNVHSAVTAGNNKEFASVLAQADLVTPDGGPIAKMLTLLGFPNQQRINGPDLMWKYCEEASQRDESIYLFGGRQSTLDKLQINLKKYFPSLKIAGSYSPPFRALTEEEDAKIINDINLSGANTVWVSLGCPKQEKWMLSHRGKINAVMIGVGAAFEYHAGDLSRAPKWMQNASLEWLFRLYKQPGYLWRRYLFTNTTFIYRATKQLIFKKN